VRLVIAAPDNESRDWCGVEGSSQTAAGEMFSRGL